MAFFVACIANPLRSPENGKTREQSNGANALSIIARYSLPPRQMTLGASSRRSSLICEISMVSPTGFVARFLKVTLYGPGIRESGEMNPYLALRMTDREAKA